MNVFSCLYSGSIMHRRLHPRMHRFRYRAWWLMLDIDELPDLCRRTHLLSHNRFNVLSLHDRDYGSGGSDLSQDVRDRLARAGMQAADTRVFLLTTPRILGFGFNPLSVYFCMREDDELAAVIYEVHNTYAERHSYVLPAHTSDNGILRHSADKTFYVSPFLPMPMRYTFRLRPPGERIDLAISVAASGVTTLHASLEGRRRPLNVSQLLWVLAAQPLSALKVIAAIHWEALRLWLKDLPIYPRPAPSAVASTAPSKPRRNKLHA